MILFSMPSFYINTIPDGHVNEYRAAILKRAKYYIIPFMGLFILGGCSSRFPDNSLNKGKEKEESRAELASSSSRGSATK
ncbi:hypothetical protein OS493_029554 [Desmophyllum pertusum]|uniref:Uncharacterized protein n=1 Tax=Desmophyllum pertusum TaxID=174260 RepID=A0A9X0D7J1_9CNID|nr:hypothetical protein OS493_029554 [Desmophyllum pertusum]